MCGELIPGFNNYSELEQRALRDELTQRVKSRLRKRPAKSCAEFPVFKTFTAHATVTSVAKEFTAEQVASKQAKAVQFLRDVVGDDGLADQFEDMSLDEYADHKGIEIVNQGKRSLKMPNGNGRTKQDLLDEIDELQQENQALQDQLDAISDIVSPSEEEDEEGDDGG